MVWDYILKLLQKKIFNFVLKEMVLIKNILFILKIYLRLI